jgi:hypothetical protein
VPTGPEVVFADVVPSNSLVYQVWWGGDAARYLGPGQLETCPGGYSLVGSKTSGNGFRLCARSDLEKREFYVGDVENNVNLYYKVSGGVVTAQQAQPPWDTCLDRSRLLSRSFEVNGFWICMK